MLFKRFAALAWALALAPSAFSQFHGLPAEAPDKPSQEKPPVLDRVSIDQKLGSQVPMNLKFRDEQNREVTLADYAGKRPIVLNLVYYGCPMLCTEILNGLTRSLRALPMEIGKDYEVVTVSFDPRETATLALEKKTKYLESLRKPGAGEAWHFLTGEQKEITELADAVGFRYVWDDKLQQFAHGSAIMLLTPEGSVSKYFYGIDYSPVNMRLGLAEASEGRVGGLVEQSLLLCYHYDPMRGGYVPRLTIKLLRFGGILTILVVGGGVLIMLRRELRARRLAQQAG